MFIWIVDCPVSFIIVWKNFAVYFPGVVLLRKKFGIFLSFLAYSETIFGIFSLGALGNTAALCYTYLSPQMRNGAKAGLQVRMVDKRVFRIFRTRPSTNDRCAMVLIHFAYNFQMIPLGKPVAPFFSNFCWNTGHSLLRTHLCRKAVCWVYCTSNLVAAFHGRCEHAAERTPSLTVQRASSNRDSGSTRPTLSIVTCVQLHFWSTSWLCV